LPRLAETRPLIADCAVLEREVVLPAADARDAACAVTWRSLLSTSCVCASFYVTSFTATSVGFTCFTVLQEVTPEGARLVPAS
jgi:hypothetical protein